MSIFKGKMTGHYNCLKGKCQEIIMFKRKMKGKDHYFKRKTKGNDYFPKGALRWHTGGS